MVFLNKIQVAKWLRDQLDNVIKTAPLFIENKVALKTPGEF